MPKGTEGPSELDGAGGWPGQRLGLWGGEARSREGGAGASVRQLQEIAGQILPGQPGSTAETGVGGRGRAGALGQGLDERPSHWMI